MSGEGKNMESANTALRGKLIPNPMSPHLYIRPLSTPGFTPQPVLDLGLNTFGPSVFLPGLTTELMHTGSDIPPNGFTPPYKPPYNVPGFGELGFNSVAQ